MQYRCAECGEECKAEIEDVGIGHYEFWGAPGCDVQLVAVSSCCGADMTDSNGEVVTTQEVCEQEALREYNY